MTGEMDDTYAFFFNGTATAEIYTLSLHDALPILTDFNKDGRDEIVLESANYHAILEPSSGGVLTELDYLRSEEHTSELQSPYDLVCRLLLEKKKKMMSRMSHHLLRILHDVAT